MSDPYASPNYADQMCAFYLSLSPPLTHFVRAHCGPVGSAMDGIVDRKSRRSVCQTCREGLHEEGAGHELSMA